MGKKKRKRCCRAMCRIRRLTALVIVAVCAQQGSSELLTRAMPKPDDAKKGAVKVGKPASSLTPSAASFLEAQMERKFNLGGGGGSFDGLLENAASTAVNAIKGWFGGNNDKSYASHVDTSRVPEDLYGPWKQPSDMDKRSVKDGSRKMQAPPEYSQGLFDTWWQMGGQRDVYETPDIFKTNPSLTADQRPTINVFRPASDNAADYLNVGHGPFMPRGSFPVHTAVQGKPSVQQPTALDTFNALHATKFGTPPLRPIQSAILDHVD